MRHSPNVDTMLGQRRRRWPDIVPALGERLVFAGVRQCDYAMKPYFYVPHYECYQIDSAGVAISAHVWSRLIFITHACVTSLNTSVINSAFLHKMK